MLTVGVGNPNHRGLGVLTQNHFEFTCVMLKIWEEQGFELFVNKDGDVLGSIRVSPRYLVKAATGQTGGEKYTRTFRMLDEMNSVRIKFETDSTSKEDGFKGSFSMISSDWRLKKCRALPGSKKVPINDSESYVRVYFSKYLTEQFLKKSIKTVGLSERKKIQGNSKSSGLDELLFGSLELGLSHHEVITKSFKGLCDDYSAPVQRKKSDRKKQAMRIVKSLQGRSILSRRFILDISLEDSADGKDFIFKARKTRA